MSAEGGVQRFENLVAWQKARKLSKRVYEITGKGDFARDFGCATRFGKLPFR